MLMSDLKLAFLQVLNIVWETKMQQTINMVTINQGYSKDRKDAKNKATKHFSI